MLKMVVKCSKNLAIQPHCNYLLDFLLVQSKYTSLSVKTDGNFEISTPDLLRTHQILSHLAINLRQPDTKKPCNGAARSLLK